jgi:hypothetical protein
MKKERNELQMRTIDLEAEAKTLTPEEAYRLYAVRLQVWLLCGNAACRRTRSCRGDARDCGIRLADWAEAVKEAGQRERADRDPETAALRADLTKRIERLAQTMRDERES